MIRAKQITVTVSNKILNEFDKTVERLNEKEDRKIKITKSGLFAAFMLKFIKKNKVKWNMILNKRAYTEIMDLINSSYKKIDVEPGKLRYNYRCQLNSVHEALEKKTM